MKFYTLQKIVMSNNVNLHRCIFLLTSFQIFPARIGFYNEFFLGNTALLIRSCHDILQFLARSCQDLTKISMEGRPGLLIMRALRSKKHRLKKFDEAYN